MSQRRTEVVKAEKRVSLPQYRLDVEHLRLWRGNQQVQLRAKPFALLHYLIQHQRRLITKEELRRALWTDMHVSPALLKGYISELRAVLQDNPESPHFIETIGRQGYQWIGAITEVKASRAE